METNPYKSVLMSYLPKADPKMWHAIADNWDYSMDCSALSWIVRQKKCSKGTALLIYWSICDVELIQYKKRDELKGTTRERFDLAKEIEKKYCIGFYTNDDIFFDPTDENGMNWTKPSKQNTTVLHKIPEIMKKQSGGKRLPHIDLNGGLPDEVVEEVMESTLTLPSIKESQVPKNLSTKKKQPEYWLFCTKIFAYGVQEVQAKLITPSRYRDNLFFYGEGKSMVSISSSMQHKPYGVPLDLTYQVNPKHPHHDNYPESNGFSLFSEKLVSILRDFDINAEYLPIAMVDKNGKTLSDLRYFIFHILDPIVDAVDLEKTQWNEKNWHDIPKIILKKAFEKRPMFVANHLFMRFMRNDLKQILNKEKITGFAFLDPAKYTSGTYGKVPEFNG